MKLILSLLIIACFVDFTYPTHLQGNAFNSWLNNNQTPNPNNGNTAFNKWLTGPGTNTNTNTGGSNPFNDPSFANALRGQIGGVNGNIGANNPNANDNAFRSFLQSNGVPNATQLPTLQECSQYTIRAGGNVYQSNSNNYRVTCALSNGRNYTESCFGQASCDYLTCKFLKCSKAIGGGSVFRVKI